MAYDRLKNALEALQREGLAPEAAQAMSDKALLRRVPSFGKRKLAAFRTQYPEIAADVAAS